MSNRIGVSFEMENEILLAEESKENEEVLLRKEIAQAERIVIKIGSRVLIDTHGKKEIERISRLVSDIVQIQKRGVEVVIVSSGAVGAGIGELGFKSRPKNIPELQMTAAVGQSSLLSLYDRLFKEQGVIIGQVLLTHDDLKDRERHLHTRNALFTMLEQKVVPIINENDTVAVNEIRFGDNDMLASLVAMLIEADVLIILSSTDGVKQENNGGEVKVPFISAIDERVLGLAHGKNGELSTGGMRSKLEAIKMVIDSNIPAMIVKGQDQGVLLQVIAGEAVGTVLGKPSEEKSKLNSKKRWLAYYQRNDGAVVVNKNAARALRECWSSLLPIGVVEVRGYFNRGSVINIVTEEGVLIGRGISTYSSEQANRIKGRRSGEIKQVLGHEAYEELVHRDNLVIL
ncbi:MAG: glutamate 5-kinase [Deltaproteobacteria bacterium]|nr:glutamate 5-kinase [Deltaproteobacteria bacterium]